MLDDPSLCAGLCDASDIGIDLQQKGTVVSICSKCRTGGQAGDVPERTQLAEMLCSCCTGSTSVILSETLSPSPLGGYTYTNDHFGVFWDFCDIVASPFEDRIVHGVCGRLATELALLEEGVMEDHAVPINKNENEGIAVLPLVSFLSHQRVAV